MSDSATPWTVARQDPLSTGILQARILEWVAMPSSRGSSQPRDQTQVSHTADSLPSEPTILMSKNSCNSYESRILSSKIPWRIFVEQCPNNILQLFRGQALLQPDKVWNPQAGILDHPPSSPACPSTPLYPYLPLPQLHPVLQPSRTISVPSSFLHFWICLCNFLFPIYHSPPPPPLLFVYSNSKHSPKPLINLTTFMKPFLLFLNLSVPPPLNTHCILYVLFWELLSSSTFMQLFKYFLSPTHL